MGTSRGRVHVLVTGGCGFIGSNFVRFLMRERPELRVTNLDALTYASDKDNLSDVDADERYRFVHGNICDPACVGTLVEQAQWVVNLAAESSVDRSLLNATEFEKTNVDGVAVLLRAVRDSRTPTRFLHVSTDEVYGSIEAPARAHEDQPLRPSNPYSATKASADLLLQEEVQRSDADVLIARPTNNYGPNQHREKLIPCFVARALQGKPLPLYDDGSQVREWLAVEDHCRALLLLLETGGRGEIYNVGSGQTPEISNRELTQRILEQTAANRELIQRVDGARPSHDQRYAVDSSKLRSLGWQPQIDFETGIAQTIRFYSDALRDR